MMDVLSMTWEKFTAFAGTGMTLALFFVALLYLFLKKDETETRGVFGWYSIAVLVLFFLPFTADIIANKMLGTNVYWRMLWLLPILTAVAYVGAKAAYSPEKARQRAVALLGVVAVIALCGQFMFTPANYQRADNLYKLPKEAVGVSEVIRQSGVDSPKATVPDELVCYIRQYDAGIGLTYGRGLVVSGALSGDEDYERAAQLPPRYAAIKVAGRKLYELARAGQTVEVAPRAVRINLLALLGRFNRAADGTVVAPGDYLEIVITRR